MTEQAIELNTDTLSGDVTAAILDKVRGTNMSWGMMPEGQQRTFAREIDELARYLVKEAVNLVAADGQPVIRAKLGAVKGNKDVAGDIDANITISGTSEGRHDLMDARGLPVMIVVADHERYIGEREPVKIDPDQKSMIDDGE